MPENGGDRVFVVQISHVKPLDESIIIQLLTWLDQIPLSKPKKILSRDFSDGVLVAEVIKHFLPKYVDLHNYTAASSTRVKETNWFHLNRRVLHRIGLEVSQDVIHQIGLCKQWFMEHFLCVLREKIDLHLAHLSARKHTLDQEFMDWMQTDRPEADQNQSPRKKTDQHTLEQYYKSKGFKSIPVEYVPQDQIYSSLSPRQRQSMRQVPEMVPREELDNRQRVLNEKENVVKILQEKIQRMDHLLQLKDIRIEDLTQRCDELEDVQGSARMPQNPSPRGAAGEQQKAKAAPPRGKQRGQRVTNASKR